jgi:hypothetical protein
MINYPMKRIAVGLAGLLWLAAASLKATPVTVTDLGIGAHQTVNITSSTLGTVDVYAGVVNLQVGPTVTKGFCIDPWHWSITGPQSYDLVSLALAPKAPTGPMGSAAAIQIEKLWNQFYTLGITDTNAAALQIEIWKVVDIGVTGGTFHLNSAPIGVMTEIGVMETWLNGDLSNAPAADLSAVISLSHSPNGESVGQDYVIPGVPDGGSTVALLGIGLLGICLIRRRAKTA